MQTCERDILLRLALSELELKIYGALRDGAKTARELVDATGGKQEFVSAYAGRLVKKGLLRSVKQAGKRVVYWRVFAESGIRPDTIKEFLR